MEQIMARRKRLVSSVVWVAFLAVPPIAAPRAGAAVMYSVTDLGTIPGSYSSSATGINETGQVVGAATYFTGLPVTITHAFLYSGGQMQDLGTLTPPTYPNYSSTATGINDNGDVVGYWYDYPTGLLGEEVTSAFFYSGGKMKDLSYFGCSQAFGINNSGQIVGSNVYGHAFVYNEYTGGNMKDLGTLGGSSSVGYCISGNGEIAGYAETASGASHAFLYSGGEMKDLGTLPGGTSSNASGVNNAGQVVGSSDVGNGISHAFLYSGGQMQDLGSLGGTVSWSGCINNAGQVVGEAYTAGNGQSAFLYSGGTMIDLNTLIDPSSGWDLVDATAINDQGQIVGWGYDPGGSYDGFLLTTTPEPATFTILALGSWSMLGRRRK
jgi:probable HAF family extracellular repeat protein